MYKRLILIVVCLMLFGCSVKGNFLDDPETVSINGELLMEKVGSGDAGSFVLKKEDGETTRLRSLSINFSKDEYLGNIVKLNGFVNPDDGFFEVTGISVIEVKKNDSEKGSMESLNSSLNGFKMPYSSTWSALDEAGNVELVYEEEGVDVAKVNVTVFPFTFDGDAILALEAFLLESVGVSESSGILSDYIQKKVGASGYDAFYEENRYVEIYYLYRPGFVYQIRFEFLVADSPIALDLKNQFLTMLSEFEFIPFEEVEQAVEVEEEGAEEELALFDGELTAFESLPYHFGGKYPKSWYYAGTKTDDSEISHHYGFSDESVTAENEKIALDLLKAPLPSGAKVVVGEREFVKKSVNGNVEYFFAFEDKVFRLSGDSEFDDLILTMALSIEPLELESPELQ